MHDVVSVVGSSIYIHLRRMNPLATNRLAFQKIFLDPVITTTSVPLIRKILFLFSLPCLVSPGLGKTRLVASRSVEDVRAGLVHHRMGSNYKVARLVTH
jgi:hypothetical protein